MALQWPCTLQGKQVGAVAAVFSNSLNCLQVSLGEYHSFDHLAVDLQYDMSVLLLIMYCTTKYNSDLTSYFADLLSNTDSMDYTKVFISGYFNIHNDNSTAPAAVSFNDILQLFDLTQHVGDPTHQYEHILDLIISMGSNIRLSAVNDVALSDHYCVFFSELLAADQPINSGHVKNLCKTSLLSFQTHFLRAKSSLLPLPESSSCDDLGMMSGITSWLASTVQTK